MKLYRDSYIENGRLEAEVVRSATNMTWSMNWVIDTLLPSLAHALVRIRNEVRDRHPEPRTPGCD